MDVVSLILLLIYIITILLVCFSKQSWGYYFSIYFININPGIWYLVSSLSPGAHKSRLFSMYSSEEMMWLAEESLTMNNHHVGISPQVVYISIYYLFIYLLSICLLLVCLSLCIVSIDQLIYLSIYLSVSLSIYLSVSLAICLFIYLSLC